MDELKKCPFCGSDDLDLSTGTEDREGIPTQIYCGECGAQGPWEYIPKQTEHNVVWAILSKAWNLRVVGQFDSIP